MSIFRISLRTLSRKNGTRILKSGRVLAQSHTRTFPKSARIMSVNHILARFPARTLAEGGNAS